MLEHFEQIEKEVVNKIYKLFLEKFNGNNSKFAQASDCSETTVRRVFRSKQRMTLNLLLRFCNSLEIDIKAVFDNDNITQKNK